MSRFLVPRPGHTPAFYHIVWKESDPEASIFLDDTMVVDSDVFYWGSAGRAQNPLLSLKPIPDALLFNAKVRVGDTNSGGFSMRTSHFVVDSDHFYWSAKPDGVPILSTVRRHSFHPKMTGDQSVATDTETVITPFLGMEIPGANGVRRYEYIYTAPTEVGAGSDTTIRVRIGQNGTIADTVERLLTVTGSGPNEEHVITDHHEWIPAAGDKITITVEFSNANANNKVFGNTTAGKHMCFRVALVDE